MKKVYLALFIIFLLLIISITAQLNQNLEIKLSKNVYQQGEKIKYTILLFDNVNNQIKEEVKVRFIDATEIQEKEAIVLTNIEQEIDLGENANFGYWKIIVLYNGKEITRIFSIESNEEIKFELINNELKIINIGNVFYSRTVQIVIGDFVESKEVKLGIGQSTTLKLVAPDRTYNIEITDGRNTIRKEDVYLTGKAVAIFSEEEQGSTLITGVENPEETTQSLKEAIKQSKLALTFIFAVFALFILIVLQRLKEEKKRK